MVLKLGKNAIKMQTIVVQLCFIVLCFAQKDLNNLPGRQALIHLFEWKWSAVAEECETFLGPKGFAGVQLSPVTEVVAAIDGDIIRPWWERYQPVSYKLMSRSGNEGDFRDMAARCNNVGVRIYVDIVPNHMTSVWPEGTETTGDSTFDQTRRSYPGVPYTAEDFNDLNCNTTSGEIEDGFDINQVRNCRAGDLVDVNQAHPHVREVLIAFLNHLIYLGVAGFRVDSSKLMWPDDLHAIFESLDDLSPEFFETGRRAFVVQEVIDLGQAFVTPLEYVQNGRVTEFKYGKFLGEAFRGFHPLKDLKSFGEDWGMLDSGDALVFIDNHDTQRDNPYYILTFRDGRTYKMALAFELAWPYGFVRMMSSYYWKQSWGKNYDKNRWIGAPHDESYNIISANITENGTCEGDWVCEHRWREVYSMVEFRNVVVDTNVTNWWDNGNNQIAFCRGDKGFIAINNDEVDMNQQLQTCLEEGEYCDVISGVLEGSTCTGKSFIVSRNGTALITIAKFDSVGVIAIHENSKIRNSL